MQKRTLAVLSLFLLLGGCRAGGPPSREVASGDRLSVSGRVTLADGSVPELAHVHWTDAESRELDHLATDAEGRFRIELPVGEELPELTVSAPFHSQVQVEIPPGMGDHFELTLRLAPYRLRSRLDEVTILGDWNDFDFSSSAPMEPQDDGMFVHTVTVPDSGRVAYQVLGVEADGRSINGTQADAFEYDGFGDYRSILLGEPGETLRIRFDPSQLRGGTQTRQVELESDPPLLGEAFALLQELAATRRELSERDEREPGELPGALARAAKRAGDTTRRHVLAERFRQETGDPAERYSWLWGQIDPQARVQVDHLVPEFSIERLDDDGVITQEDLKGRYTLLDFWGTWCGPCVRELPELHAAWERFEDENFQIVSIAFDEPAEAVEEFRAERFPMPWEHAVVEEGMDSPVAKTFEIVAIPRPILVGPDGTILAMEGDLRGDDLEPTLERFLSPAS
ncbi:MAG: thioredoxin-like domain-containing protein [Thermoanaerobaculia bacterium]